QMRGSGIVITRLRFFFHAEDGIRDSSVTGVQTCALPISRGFPGPAGVQLGQGSLEPEDARRLNPAWWIGKSVHDLREAEAAHAGGADYLLVGPVFPTATHPDRAPLGLARLQEIVGIGLPVIAIGGVTPERMPELMAGAA